MTAWLRRRSARRHVLGVVLVLAAATPPPAAVAQLLNRADPLPGITTSGQPDEADLDELAEAGFTTIIDLRGPDEDRGIDERKAVEELGMTYVSLPVEGPGGVTYENAAALERILRDADGPVLIHCSTGNRAGGLLSLRQRLLGDDAEHALALGIEAGLSSPVLRDAVETSLRQPERRLEAE